MFVLLMSLIMESPSAEDLRSHRRSNGEYNDFRPWVFLRNWMLEVREDPRAVSFARVPSENVPFPVSALAALNSRED